MEKLMLKNGSKEKHFRGNLQSLTILFVLSTKWCVIYCLRNMDMDTIQHDIDVDMMTHLLTNLDRDMTRTCLVKYPFSDYI